jgi:fructose-1,6-bisphosphatase/inositol monophosphatase family enzyme
VEEAGGKVSELRGGAIRYAKDKFAQRGGLVATNGHLHDESLERLRSLPWS